MKINDIGGNDGPRRSDGLGNRTESRKPEGAGRSERDRVEVSGAARRMVSLADAAGRLPEVRADRVAELRGAIQSASYEVDPHALARAILELEDGLFR